VNDYHDGEVHQAAHGSHSAGSLWNSNTTTGGGPPAERQNRARPLSITGIGCAYQFASHVMVGLCGTPSRGAILIRVQCDPCWAYDTYAGRMLPDPKREVLLQFLLHVTGFDSHLIPWDFYWRQPKP
jgi:hypothetical protein